MFARTVLSLALIAIVLGIAIPTNEDFVQNLLTLQGRTGAPPKWMKTKTSEEIASNEITFTIITRQCNLDVLEQKFWDISNPKSENYAKYMTIAELETLTRCPGDLDVIKKFLDVHGVTKYYTVSSGVKVTVPVKVAEDMFKTTFFEYQHSESGKSLIRQEGRVLVPPEVSEVVQFITGVSDFFHDNKFSPIKHQQSQFKKNMAAATNYDPNIFDISDPYVTPKLLRILYNIPSDEAVFDPTNHIGIAAFDNDYDDEALCRFQGLFNDYSDPPMMHYLGPPEGSDQVESDLDVQYSTIIANGAHEVFDNHPPGDWILDWTQDAVSLSSAGVYVWSISYGWPEIWQCIAIQNQTITNCPTGYDYQDYINAVNTELQKLGTLGVTVFVSSGDDGTPGFAANCPIDPNQPFNGAGKSCATVFADGVCNCGELMITYSDSSDTYNCPLPNGLLYPSDCMNIPTSGLALCAEVWTEFTAHQFTGPNGESCNISADSGLTGNVPYFYSNCSCSDFTPISRTFAGMTCSIQGYEFDVSNGPAFLPDFPTSSPYVTSVGATAIQFGNECSSKELVSKPEIYCVGREAAGFSGGGGFSSFQPQPTYQQDFVTSYVRDNLDNMPPSGTFDPAMRGYPDIALNGHNYVVSIGLSAFEENINPQGLNGVIMPISGTSASSPATAAIFTLINDYLLANGLPTLGFVNQLLYQLAAENPETFTDIQPQEIDFNNNTITAGAFSGCTQQYCCQFGFPVAAGWDAATGLGTPNYEEILFHITEMWSKKLGTDLKVKNVKTK